MIEDLFSDMASKESKQLAIEMCAVMREIRQSHINKDTDKPISIRALCAKNNMDFSILSRAENPDELNIPSLLYWLDWTDALGVELGDIIQQARKRLKKSGE